MRLPRLPAARRREPVAEPTPRDAVVRRRLRRLRVRTEAHDAALAVLEAQVAGLTEFQLHAAPRLADLDGLLDHVRAAPGSHAGAMRVSSPSGGAMGYVDEQAGDEDAAYVQFENLFRGSREEIQDRQRPYLDLVRGRGQVLDLGCGRGEFLEVLRDEGLTGRGVDLDAGMVASATGFGLDARVGDLFEVLAETPTSSVGAVVSFQVVEHLAPFDMRRLLREVHRVLTDDGLAIIETVNPHSLRAARFFYLDLTHTVPVFPESLLGIARAVGFTAAVAFFPGTSGDLATDLREQGDYALVAARSPAVLGSLGLLEH